MYSQQDIDAITDIPALVGAFAASAGWTVDSSNPDQPIVTHPTLGGAIAMKMTALVESSTSHYVQWAAATSLVPTSAARVHSPVDTNGIIVLPTKIKMYGGVTPEPYLAVVIEYTANLFRHIYFGYMETIGGYTGGEIISVSEFRETSPLGRSIGFREKSFVRYLFQGNTAEGDNAHCGGVNVNHVDNANQWRLFWANFVSMTTPVIDGVIGGFGDDINDGYLSAGRSAYAGSNILVPINLYAIQSTIGDSVFVPIGRPAGVRNVNMQDLDPAAVVDVGGELWHCFPAWAKNASTAMPQSGTNWRQYESSYFVGHAYLEG